MRHRSCGRLNIFAGLDLGARLRAAEGAAVMGLGSRIRIEHGTIALIDVGARLSLAIHGRSTTSAAIEEPVPVGDVDVPPVPTEEADVPPTAADPPVPPDMLVCAASGADVAKKSATAVKLIQVFISAFLLW